MSRPKNIAIRGKILCAAYGLFHERGYKGVSMDDVASASGIKKANLFHYFPTKEDLGLAVFDHAAVAHKAKLGQSGADEDPLRAVDRMFTDHISNMRKTDCCRGCFMGNLAQEMSDENEKLRSRISEHFRYWTAQLAQRLEAAQARKLFRKDFKPREAALAILSLLEGALLLCKANKETGSLQCARKMATAYLGAYRA